MLHVGGKVAAGDAEQQVGASGAAAGGVVGEPSTQHQRRTGLHGGHGRRDRVGLG